MIHTYNLDIQHGDLSQNEEPSDDIRVSDIIPLVINTMGWTKGFGANLAKQLEEIVEPSYIFDFQSQDSQTTDYFDPLHAVRPDSRDTPAQHLLEAILPSSISRQYTPADLRSLSVLSYFHAHFSSKYLSTPLFNTYATSWDTSLPLCAQPPYEVIANVKTLDLVILIGPDADDVVPSELHRVLNGAVVGLVSNDPGTLDLPSEIESLGIDSDGIPYIQGATPPSPTTSTCLGLALIRSVSVAQDPSQDSVLHLLTPIPPAYLATKQPRVLVKGDLEIPVWGMLDYREGSDGGALGYERDRVPYLRWGKGEGLGGERRRVRRNLMRKGQQ